MSSYRYRKSHCGNKTVVRSSYLHSVMSYTCKMTSLYWIRALVVKQWCVGKTCDIRGRVSTSCSIQMQENDWKDKYTFISSKHFRTPRFRSGDIVMNAMPLNALEWLVIWMGKNHLQGHYGNIPVQTVYFDCFQWAIHVANFILLGNL